MSSRYTAKFVGGCTVVIHFLACHSGAHSLNRPGPELGVFVPPIPIGCLVREKCTVGLESNSQFAAPRLHDIASVHLESEQPLEEIKPDMYVVGIRPGTNFDFDVLPAVEFDAMVMKSIDELKEKALLPPAQRYTDKQREELANTGKRELSDPPAEVAAQLDRYYQSDEYFRCSATEKALAAVRAKTFKSRRADFPLLILAYTRYVEACFHNSAGALTPALQRFALIVTEWPPKYRSKGIFCAGFLVASGNLVTAKHCALNRPTAGMRRPIPLGLPPKTYAFFPFLSERKHQLSLAPHSAGSASSNFDPSRPQDDFVYLVVEKSPETDVPQFPISAPRDWDQLYFIGSFIALPDLLSIFENPSERKKFLDKAIKFDTSANCRVFKVKDRCVYHACQTVGGFSGSPLLAVRSNLVALVGVHTGAADLQAPACKFRKARYFPNYGVSLKQ